MKKNTPSDGILVFDRYYGRKPIVVLLVFLRVVFCAAFSASSMMFVFSQYGFRTVSLGYVGIVSALSAATLSLLFMIAKRRYALPAVLLTAGFLIYKTRDVLFERLTYFADEFMLLAEGRFIDPRDYLFNDISDLSVFNREYSSGMALGAFILCAAFGMLCALSMKRRIRAVPAVLAVSVLCVPCLLAESFDLDMWFLPFVLLTAAAVAVSLNYNDGLAVVRSGASAYRSQIKSDEARLVSKSNKAGLVKRISMQICFYSKYATSGLYCAALFATVLFIGMSVFDQGEAIDYTAVFEYFEELGNDDAEITLSDDAVSDYFSGPDKEDDGLSITSPGRGNKNVIKVTFTGDKSIYLRGDIGIAFTGTSWLTPVNDDKKWTSSDLAEHYRPAELRILSLLLSELTGGVINVAAESDITIDYLTETDVVFLPAYTGDFSFYNNKNFDVYGDYCVRVSDTAGSYINTVKCTAVLHDMYSNGGEEIDAISDAVDALEEYGLSVNDLYSTVVMDVDAPENVIKDYSEYVCDTYLDVPADISAELTVFMKESGLNDILSEYQSADSVALYRYLTASAIDEYLNTNYTYSLSNSNRGEGAVMRFLRETKQGHCSLYASAMTLMLRDLGIPARYCTGFAVHPETINGNTKVFKEKDLHAWVEVYIDEFGWVTFDPTSAAVNAMATAGRDETAQSPAPTTSRPPRTERPEPTDEPSDTSEETMQSEDETVAAETSDDTNEGDGISEKKKPIPIKLIVSICATAAVILITTLIVWRYNNIRKRAELVLSASGRSASDIYDCIVDILHYHKLSPEAGELPAAFYERADKTFAAGLYAERTLLEAAAFGGSIGAEGASRLSKLLSELYSAAMVRNGIIRRYRLRKLILSRFSVR